MGKPENAVEQHLRTLIERAGGLCLKFTSSRAGVPDRIVILQGRVVFVELKAPGGRIRPLQRVRHDELRARGADVRVLASREAVEQFMAEFASP